MQGNPNSPQPGQPGGVQTMPSNGGANQMPPTSRPMPGLPGTPQTMGVNPAPGGGMPGQVGTPGAGAYNPGGAGPAGQRSNPGIDFNGNVWNPQLAAIYSNFQATGHGPGWQDPNASAGAAPPGMGGGQPQPGVGGPGRIMPGAGMGGDVGGPGGGQWAGMHPQIQAMLAQNPQLMQAFQRMRMGGGNPGQPGIMPSNPGANSGAYGGGPGGGGLLGLLGGIKPGMQPGGQIQNPMSNA